MHTKSSTLTIIIHLFAKGSRIYRALPIYLSSKWQKALHTDLVLQFDISTAGVDRAGPAKLGSISCYKILTEYPFSKVRPLLRTLNDWQCNGVVGFAKF